MSLMVLLIGAALLASGALTAAVRHYALKRSVLDIPNERSAHTRPTPRGGGLAIAAAFFGSGGVAAGVGLVPAEVFAALLGGGVLVAGVGWVDDHRHVPARWRALVHFVAAGWAVFQVGGLPVVRLGPVELPFGTGGAVLATVGIVWFINLFNFMDGIDGIAAGEAVSVGAIGGLALWAMGAERLAGLPFLIAAASAGFLLWNWSPARIFMGDVGSGLLGFLFAVTATASENARALPLLAWVLLAGVFVFDATITLARRVARGERWYDAHSSHAYQRAVRAGWSHAQVSGAVVAVNGTLGGLLALGYMWPRLWIPAVLAATGLLVGLYLAVERVHPMQAHGKPAGEERPSVAPPPASKRRDVTAPPHGPSIPLPRRGRHGGTAPTPGACRSPTRGALRASSEGVCTLAPLLAVGYLFRL